MRVLQIQGEGSSELEIMSIDSIPEKYDGMPLAKKRRPPAQPCVTCGMQLKRDALRRQPVTRGRGIRRDPLLDKLSS